MRILGAKFKFSVGHGKFNFPPLYAEIALSGRIPIVSFAIETIIAVDLKSTTLGLFFQSNLYIFRHCYAKKWLQERQKSEDLSADLCFPMSRPYFFVFAGAAGTFFFGLLGLVLPQIPEKKKLRNKQKKKRHVTSVPPSR